MASKLDASNGRPDSFVSRHECEAMRQLDKDPDYSRSEIAFMFETGSDTVTRHCDEDCQHSDPLPGGPGRGQKYDRADMRAAFLAVHNNQPYQQMSAGVYDDRRLTAYPSADTIVREYGSWTDARDAILGTGDDG